MRKALMIVSLTAFAAVSAVAAPRRDVSIPADPSTTEEVVVNPGDDHGTVSNFPVDEKTQGCGCGNKNKPKKNRR